MKSALQYLFVLIWTVWSYFSSGVVTVFLFFFFVIGVLIGHPKIIYYCHRLPQWVSFGTFFCIGARIEEENRHLVDFSEPQIYVSNHASFLDPYLTYILVRNNYLKFLAKSEILSYPIFGYVIKHTHVPVNRGSKEARQKSMEQMIQALDQGASIAIYPEGTRTKKDELLGQFKSGAFRLAIATQKPLVVVACPNARDLMGGRTWLVKPGKIKAIWHQAIETKGMTEADIPALQKRVWDMMYDDIVAYYANQPVGSTEWAN